VILREIVLRFHYLFSSKVGRCGKCTRSRVKLKSANPEDINTMTTNLDRFHASSFIRAQSKTGMENVIESLAEYVARKVEFYVKSVGIECGGQHILLSTKGRADALRIPINRDHIHNQGVFTRWSLGAREHIFGIVNDLNERLMIMTYKSDKSIAMVSIVGEKTYHCDYFNDPPMEILEWIPSFILAPDLISPRYNDAFMCDPLSIFGGSTCDLDGIQHKDGEVTFFPENFPSSGNPIILSRASIAAFCGDRFQDKAESRYTLDGIAQISEAAAMLVEMTLDLDGFARDIDASMNVDDAQIYLDILHYLGVRW